MFLIGASSLYKDILSKVTADDTGVMSLLDCVFVKTDVGAVVTQGKSDVIVFDTGACVYVLLQLPWNMSGAVSIYNPRSPLVIF